MSKTVKSARALAAVFLLIAAQAASAITVTLDEYHKTVVRPTSGTVQVDFTGTITLTPGFEFASASATSLWDASGDLIEGVFPHVTFNTTGVLFSVLVGATDNLALYSLNSSLTGPASILWSDCPPTSGLCNNTPPVNYSVNVVGTAVPEPSTLAVFGLGLLGVVAIRSKRRQLLNRSA